MAWRVRISRGAGSLVEMARSEAKVLSAEALQARFGRALSAARKAKGMTQEEVANLAGVGWRHIQKIEAGQVNTTLRTICQVANALEIDPHLLFQEEGKT